MIRTIPLADYVAATSVGIVDGEPLLDLAYDDDSRADVDMNIVKTGDGRFIEVQGTAEAMPFGRDALNTLLDLADHGHPAADREAARDRRAPREIRAAERPRSTIRLARHDCDAARRRCWRSRRTTGLCALEFTARTRAGHRPTRRRRLTRLRPGAGFPPHEIVDGERAADRERAHVARRAISPARAPTSPASRSTCAAPNSRRASGARSRRFRRARRRATARSRKRSASPGASRAVGAGERREPDRHHRPLPPRDRSSGSLTGYGGGLDRKTGCCSTSAAGAERRSYSEARAKSRRFALCGLRGSTQHPESQRSTTA